MSVLLHTMLLSLDWPANNTQFQGWKKPDFRLEANQVFYKP